MPFVSPYITDKFTAYQDMVVLTKLSMAIWLIDDYTKKEPIGEIKIKIQNRDTNEIRNVKAAKNLSGYFIYKDLPDARYSISIEPELYFPIKEIPVDLPLPDSKNPVIDIKKTVLKPMSSYPFPGNATLIRGIVSNTDSAENPVPDANITAGKLLETFTDKRGEFVLYFRGIDKKRITVKIENGGVPKYVYPTVEEGKMKYLGIITLPQ